MNYKITPAKPILVASMLVAAPSAAVMAKYGIGFSWLMLVVFIYVGVRFALSRPPTTAAVNAVNDTRWMLFVLTILSLLVVAFLIVYPHVNSTMPGRGSDRDDALNLAAEALLRGKYPYSNMTYLGNPITPLPGAIILALPFVMLGNSAYQALPWILLWLIAVRRASCSRLVAIVTVSAILLSPEVLRETLSGGDLFVNGIYVCLSSAWLANQVVPPFGSKRRLLAAAALFGLALASRPNFMVIWPIVICCVVRSNGLRVGAYAAFSSIAALVVATLPLYLMNPPRFSPLHVLNKIDFVAIPHAALVISGSSILLAILLASVTHRARVMWDCTIATCFPMVLTSAFASLDAKALILHGLSYGVCFLPFLGLSIVVRDHKRLSEPNIN